MTVSFRLTPEQEHLKLGARQFAEEYLAPLAAEVRAEADQRRRALLARPVFEKAVAAGFLKGLIPVPFGGAAAGGVEACILVEEWACHSPDFVISMAGPLIALAPVYQVGTPEQIRRFVAPFLAGPRGCLTARIRLHDVRVPRSNLLGAEGQGVQLTNDAFWASGASIGIFAVAAMRQAFDAAYRYALTQKRGGAVPIIDHQSVADALVDARSRIEAVRLLSWRALDAVIAQDPAGPELALHAKIFGSDMAVEVITRLMNVVGVQAYDNNFPLMGRLSEALAYPVIEGSNNGIRRRQLQDLFRTPGYSPLSASGMA